MFYIDPLAYYLNITTFTDRQVYYRCMQFCRIVWQAHLKAPLVAELAKGVRNGQNRFWWSKRKRCYA